MSGHKVTVVEGPALSPQDVAERMEAITETYATPELGEVTVADGFGVKLTVERGHLSVADGVGPHRRERRYAKVEPPSRLVAGIGACGFLTFDVLRWCAATGTQVTSLGRDGAILAAGPPGRSDAKLLRAQCMALYQPVGVEIARYLLSAKLHGQAKLVAERFCDHEACSTILELATDIESATSLEELRQLESSAANRYFYAFEQAVEVVFATKDRGRIPAHWFRFNGRRSKVYAGTPRGATDPCGAMLNYAYKLAEVEATLAARYLGLAESVGILHGDHSGRPSLACDLMEPVRPIVDACVLEVCAGPLRKRDFAENVHGVVSVMTPLSHRLAQAMPTFGAAVAPVAEKVAAMLAKGSPYKSASAPTVLTGRRHSEAARRRWDDAAGATKRSPMQRPTGIPPRGRRRRLVNASLPLPLAACQRCGGALPARSNGARSQRRYCDTCATAGRREGARAAATAWQGFEAKAGPEDPEQRRVLTEEVLPTLAASNLTTVEIGRAANVSRRTVSDWLSGRQPPHRRHWSTLAGLAGVELPGGTPSTKHLPAQKAKMEAETGRGRS